MQTKKRRKIYDHEDKVERENFFDLARVLGKKQFYYVQLSFNRNILVAKYVIVRILRVQIQTSSLSSFFKILDWEEETIHRPAHFFTYDAVDFKHLRVIKLLCLVCVSTELV